ncbi:MAG: UDP-3-O-(3-hydroxymyristoyl)glucosamine N-acyltransferase [Flavobacteriales bacterium]|nr:UDP-3-O-(3-hydroxymyristoyl)glucosamine N-acyltransferase [Flavobacteriales bacterium]
MKFKPVKTLKEIADFLECEFSGPEDHVILGINEIHRVETGDIVFVDHPKYYKKALESAATTIIIDKKVECPEGKGLLISSQPFDDFNRITRHFSPFKQWTSAISETVQIGTGTIIHPNVSIGNGVIIGENCMIHAGVVLMDGTILGNHVIIQPNTTIGTHAFYYKKKESGYDRMYSCGNVILEDHVEIGALCSIDAGVTSSTIIGTRTKIDNQVHIGHDTIIGKDCLFAAQVGIAGCVNIEDNVTLWGQVGIPANITIGAGAVFLGQSAPSKDVEGGKTYLGSPAAEARIKFRELALLRKLPVIIESL